MTTSARLLQLLSLFQSRPRWTGTELAERLGVTPRTIRRDVNRLRGLGYPVDAGPGEAGGYELGRGGSLPPLLLDDDEATAVAVALGAAAGAAVRDIEHAALSALSKVDRLLPPQVRGRVGALRDATVRLAPRTDDVDAAVLTDLAQCCGGNERCTVVYRDRQDHESERRLEPYRLVSTGRRWYVLAWDVDRADWRTFRVDRIAALTRTGHRFVPVADPPDAAALVGTSITTSPYRYQALVGFPDTPPVHLRARVPPTVGVVEPDATGGGSTLQVGSDDLNDLVAHLVALDLAFVVHGPPELERHVRVVHRRLGRAVTRPAR